MYRFDQGNLQGVPDYGSDMERDNARFEIEMRRLQASNAYSMADQQNRAKMEAQLIAMKEGFLPAPMAQNLIGVPEYNGQPNNGAQPGGGQYQDSGDGFGASTGLGLAGGIGGAIAGQMNRASMANGLASAGSRVAGMSPVGTMADEVLRKASAGTLNKTDDFLKGSKARPGSVFDKIRQGAGKGGIKTASALDSLGMKVAGKGSTKAAGSVLGKLAGGVASKGLVGAAIGGIPGFLTGTAIGAAIEKLMEGNEKDQAKAQFMLSQYR